MDKLLTASEYGICLFSFNVLQDFLKKNQVKETSKSLPKKQGTISDITKRRDLGSNSSNKPL